MFTIKYFFNGNVKGVADVDEFFNTDVLFFSLSIFEM
ncbi:Hypothetical protein LRC_17930 [Ligilactobacillus ruminis ATCC 27782]|uniref:Uncharacterized protein n=1 Tax=Ligilactobacillus ruminis (strain ATCC 27782 / RF3) TaxID=1069534 RepID=G2SM37_LIGR2|nr:Hypothetical protein LRC_17930 [Ligilactobacillus ruminis ATCC 27782]